MDTKLTLKLNAHAIGRAKRYTHLHRGSSLSKLVENYFNSLTKNQTKDTFSKLTPIVSGLAGIAKKGKGLNSKKDYTEYLIEKYQ
ncbi:MAG: DUF6364 family protein [Chitinivibrionales bacterium]|nr:DUF6364 family protein [Chitinivibrionales bacterium]